MEYYIDFGTPVEVEKAVFFLRADFPHDTYWKEMDIENAFSYSSSLIAIDGTDIRLPYSAAPGKLVVEVDSYIYVLTLESATA